MIAVFNKGDTEYQLENSVDAVRVVRDSRTRIGKGIAYVMFKSRVAALTALQLNDTECKGRKMRVNRVEKNPASGNSQATLKRSKKGLVPSRRHDRKSDGTPTVPLVVVHRTCIKHHDAHCNTASECNTCLLCMYSVPWSKAWESWM